MNNLPLTVLKFGGSVLIDDQSLTRAVHEIYAHIRNGHRVVAVVSAQGATTDALVARARAITSEPDPVAYAAFLATGETRSAAALALAADQAGIPTRQLNGCELGIETTGSPLSAEPVALHSRALDQALAASPLVVVPGFVGASPHGVPTLLGRGGSDMTAIFLAAQLRATRCILIKDVDGWFVEDPKIAGTEGTRYAYLDWDEAITVPATIVQDRAVLLARRLSQRFEVAAFGSTGGTMVGPDTTRLDKPAASASPLDVVLLGCGVVGSGVVRHLLETPERYRVRSIVVRDRSRKREQWIPASLLTTDPTEALTHPGIVVELMGGVSPTRHWIETALRAGRPVVTANKRLLAEAGPELEALAAVHGTILVGSAAVGGATPMLETVDRIAQGPGVRSLRGIVNGTCNWILDRVAAGDDYEAAVAEAQRRGFAEADPTADVSGLDAAHKLLLLARAASRRTSPHSDVMFSGIEHLQRMSSQRSADGQRLRLVATYSPEEAGRQARASVGLEWLAPDEPLFAVTGAWNALDIVDTNGQSVVIRGRGAGRWPTAEAVLADVEIVRRRLANSTVAAKANAGAAA